MIDLLALHKTLWVVFIYPILYFTHKTNFQNFLSIMFKVSAQWYKNWEYPLVPRSRANWCLTGKTDLEAMGSAAAVRTFCSNMFGLRRLRGLMNYHVCPRNMAGVKNWQFLPLTIKITSLLFYASAISFF